MDAPTDAKCNEIVRLYADGLSIRAIRQRLRIKPEAVPRALSAAGVKRRPPGGRWVPVDVDELVRLYRDEGLSTRAVAAHLDIAPQTVLNRLKTAGVPRRKPGGLAPEVPTDEIVRLYRDEGLSMRAVGRRVGIGKGAVRTCLTTEGVKVRRRP